MENIKDIEKQTSEQVEEVAKEMTEQELKELITAQFDSHLEAMTEKLNAKVESFKNNPEKIKSKEELPDLETRNYFEAVKDKNYAYLKEKYMTTADDDDAAAGLTIPEELLREVLRVQAAEYGVARREMRYLPFSGVGNSRRIPKLGSACTVAWTDEGAIKHKTQPSFEIVVQTLKKLTAIVTMTEEILEDTAINLTQLISELIAEEVAKEVDTQFLAGTGSPWTGVLNNANCIQHATTSAAITGLTADDILDAYDKLPASIQGRAKIYCHRTVVSVLRKLKGTDGQYIFQGPTGGAPATCWGMPIVVTEVLPGTADTAANKKFMFIGDLRTAAIYGDKQQIRFKLLDQATIGNLEGDGLINLAEQDMIALRFVMRVGYVCSMPETMVVIKTAESSS